MARLHEAQIPVRPHATGTYNVDHAYGTAEDAMGTSSGWPTPGPTRCMCLIQMGTVPQEVCMETIRQWGEKIIPRFR